MPNQKNGLALGFLQSHPASAAATLEQHPIEEVSLFLQEVPSAISARVVQCFMPHYISRVLELLPAPVVASIFKELAIGQVAAILRHFSRKNRVEILETLPTRFQVGCNLLLKFSPDMIGAWITPQVATIPYDYSVLQALNHLKETTEIVQTDSVFVISRYRDFKGRLKLIELIRASADIPISDLTTQNGGQLRARGRLVEAGSHRDWKRFHEIPVINRNKKFIGVLCHTELRKGLDHLKPNSSGPVPVDMGEPVTAVYGEAMLAIAESMAEIFKPQKSSV